MINKFGAKSYDYSKPEEEIVKIAKLFKKENIKTILDLGCGEGRHLKYLTEIGFNVYGIDIDKNAIEKLRRQLSKISNKLIVGNMNNLPYQNNFFDAVIANQVIYHTTKEDMKKIIFEIYRILKNKGLFFVTLQTKKNQEWRKGKKIEEWTYIASAGPDKGVIHHFIDRKEIDELFDINNLIKVYENKQGDWCILGKVIK